MPITKYKWDTATNCAPKVCEGCGNKLEKPKAKGTLLIKPCKQFPQGLVSSTDTQWRVDCKCGVCYLWSWPNIYIKTHRIFELAMHRLDSGKLLVPKEVLLNL